MVIHINNIIEVEMNKLLLLTALLLSTLNAYHIYDAILQHQVRDINWPFTVCGDGSWEIKKLTLGGQPARNTNDDITIVTCPLSRLEKPKTTSTSRKPNSPSNSTASSSTTRRLTSATATATETPSSSNTPTSSPALPLPAPMGSPSTSKPRPTKTTAVSSSASNCDLYTPLSSPNT